VVQADLRSTRHLGLCASSVGVPRNHFDDVVSRQRDAVFSALHEFAEGRRTCRRVFSARRVLRRIHVRRDEEIAARARPGARVGTEIPTLADYYAKRAGRTDLSCTEFSPPSELEKFAVGDFLIDARGRTYYSNQAMLQRVRQASKPAFTISVGDIPAADVYVLDAVSLKALRGE